MLPRTFENDPLIRFSKAAIGIFAIAILTAGFCVSGLLAFAVRSPLFQADAIFLPSLTSCIVGVLTICYNFIISPRFYWNTPALLTVLAAALSTLSYAGLLFYTRRKISALRSRGPSILRERSESGSMEASASRWQDPIYYENYVRNMFPASAHPSMQTTGYDPNSITEEEMQRQQMLMLLLHQPQASTPNASQSTFRIDWQGQDQDDLPPTHGYYAPHSASTASSAYPSTGTSRQWTNQQLRPWDGVWRDPVPAPSRVRATSQELREERRREIEMGR